jgi:hypothetical protein
MSYLEASYVDSAITTGLIDHGVNFQDAIGNGLPKVVSVDQTARTEMKFTVQIEVTVSREDGRKILSGALS